MNFFKSLCMSLALLISTAAFAGPVDINTADAGTMAEAIVGVGETKAIAIVEYRSAHGPFVSVDDLVRVKGIGTKTVEKNRANLTASTPSQ